MNQDTEHRQMALEDLQGMRSDLLIGLGRADVRAWPQLARLVAFTKRQLIPPRRDPDPSGMTTSDLRSLIAAIHGLEEGPYFLHIDDPKERRKARQDFEDELVAAIEAVLTSADQGNSLTEAQLTDLAGDILRQKQADRKAKASVDAQPVDPWLATDWDDLTLVDVLTHFDGLQLTDIGLGLWVGLIEKLDDLIEALEATAGEADVISPEEAGAIRGLFRKLIRRMADEARGQGASSDNLLLAEGDERQE